MKKPNKSIPNLLISKRIAIIRILFGIVWAVDAAFKFQPSFYRNQSLLTYIKAKNSCYPGWCTANWLNPFYHATFKIIGYNPQFFAILVIITEVFIAVSLLFGIARRLNYVIAIPFSFLIWAIGENFGGPYYAGTTDINAGFIYVIAFLLLYVVDGYIPPSWSIDAHLDKRISWWHYLSSPKKV